mmetsp:Transcript_13314/g.19476  ORF Transcript_13314/g.19476 Transcript_13314/m.19476 type:complete len:251 (+) Transcript_13314:72-824(+)
MADHDSTFESLPLSSGPATSEDAEVEQQPQPPLLSACMVWAIRGFVRFERFIFFRDYWRDKLSAYKEEHSHDDNQLFVGQITDLKRYGTQYGVKFQYSYESKYYQRMHYVCIPNLFSSTEIPSELEPGNSLRLIMIPDHPESALPLETWKKAKIQNIGDKLVPDYFFGSGLHLMAFIIVYCVNILCFFDTIYLPLPIFLCVLSILLIFGIFGLNHCVLFHYYQPLFYNNILLNGGGLVTVRAEMSSPLLA